MKGMRESKVGLFINYHMNCDSSLSEGYDWCALYTVRIPFYYTTAWNVEPEPRSGMLTIPLPEGYDGATARFKYQNSSYFGDVSWAEVSSYTGTTISFPVNKWPKSAGSYSDGNTKTIVRYTSILVEYKAAQEPEAPVIIEGTNGTWQKDPDHIVQKKPSEIVRTKTPGRVKLKSVKNRKRKTVVIKYRRVRNAKKYQIQYAKNSKFKKAVIRNTKKLTFTIRKLKKGKKYYIRVRGINGEKKGKWSKVKKVIIKK